MNTPLPGFEHLHELLPKDLASQLSAQLPALNTAAMGVIPPFLNSMGQVMQSAFSAIDLNKLNELQSAYLQETTALMSGLMGAFGMSGAAATPHSTDLMDKVIEGDKRFSAKEWHDHGFFELNAALYSINAKYTRQLVESVPADPKTKVKLKYAVGQFVDAMSPSNFFATNPEAQKKLLDSKGESLRISIENMIADFQKGRISQTDEAAFEIGKNVATTEGTVVFENELFQLIQYKPSTEVVGARPMLFVPPAINKYYILDLQPDNSLVSYVVGQGHTLFLVSWRNVTEEQGQVTWDEYIDDGVITAIKTVREISKQETINVLGFCVGGTLLTTGLAVLAARGDRWVESLTLLTTLLDFSDTGVLGVFVDEAQVQAREQTIGNGGVMPGKDLAGAFSSLRPNDLVWNYVVNNYLKGEKPPAFDLLYWNADSTNLPGPMFCWYLRNTYLENKLCVPNQLTVCGESLDFSLVDVPAYILATREDHIVPWNSAYRSCHLLSGPVRFALGASGHIAGVINPASKNKRSFWINDALPEAPEQWLEGATEHKGSWWNDWSAWLAAHKGNEVKAPRKPGNTKYKAIESAPGRYVKVRAN